MRTNVAKETAMMSRQIDQGKATPVTAAGKAMLEGADKYGLTLLKARSIDPKECVGRT